MSRVNTHTHIYMYVWTHIRRGNPEFSLEFVLTCSSAQAMTAEVKISVSLVTL